MQALFMPANAAAERPATPIATACRQKERHQSLLRQLRQPPGEDLRLQNAAGQPHLTIRTSSLLYQNSSRRHTSVSRRCAWQVDCARRYRIYPTAALTDIVLMALVFLIAVQADGAV